MSSLVVRSSLWLALWALFASCGINDCGPFEDRFRTTDFATATYHVVLPADSLAREPGLRPIVSDTLAYDAFGILMAPVPEHYFSSARSNPPIGLVPAAYACDPVPPASDEIVRAIRITSTADYRSGYPAGSDLAGLFDVFVLDYARGVYYERYGLSEYLAREPHTVDEIVLVLNTPPDATAEHAFTVSYAQDGSGLEFYEFETDAITLRPERSAVVDPQPRSR